MAPAAQLQTSGAPAPDPLDALATLHAADPLVRLACRWRNDIHISVDRDALWRQIIEARSTSLFGIMEKVRILDDMVIPARMGDRRPEQISMSLLRDLHCLVYGSVLAIETPASDATAEAVAAQ